MTLPERPPREVTWIHWRPGGLDVDLFIDSDGHVWIQSVCPAGQKQVIYPFEEELDHALPVAQVRVAAEGNIRGTSERIVYSASSHRATYLQHREWTEYGDVHCLEIVTHDRAASIEVRSRFCVFGDIPVLRSTTYVENKGTKEVDLQTVASLSLGYLNRGSERWWEDYKIWIANNTNFREAQWKSFELGDLGMDYVGSCDFNLPGTRAAIVRSNIGTFSTNSSLPMGALARRDGTQCYMWQIENSGAWRWELGNILKGLYVVAGGPNGQDHQWNYRLAPKETFVGVSTALTVVGAPTEVAFAAFTRYRRRIRRTHADNELLPVIFNDYMNCLEGDPTEQKVASLIEPAQRIGAECFCIDAGWYAEDAGWWDTVGAWEPSKTRFPCGLKALLKRIRTAGMVPGLWLEPEVMGVNCPKVTELPDEAFFQRRGRRVVEQGRYQLDFRHAAVRSRLDAIVDRLITEYSVGYFKFDYNIDVSHGTDVNSSSPGSGMLGHRRAYLAWINAIYDRHPHVILESCSSGAQRLDYHMLATHSIFSTSDQTDPLLYSAISASISTAATPEQAASWAFPQPHYSDDLNALCMVNSLLGRVHLSGRIDLLSKSQMELVTEGIDVYKQIRDDIKDSLPFWPIGLHQNWHQHWLVLGLRCRNRVYLAVWRRGGDDLCSIPTEGLEVDDGHALNLYPKNFETGIEWDSTTSSLDVKIPNAPSARVLVVERQTDT